MQIISRGQGRSAVAAAAYRSGQKLIDHESGRISDFSNRRGVVHTEIMAPAGGPAWLSDRDALWNGVQHLERRRDAQLAREINMALPHELSDAERLALVRDYVREHFVGRGMVADIAIHRPVAEKGEDPRNHHAHIMLSLRQATAQGFREVKTREWNSPDLLRHWRAAWAECQNRYLERRPGAKRVDHRSLPEQHAKARERGDRLAADLLDRPPERHMGPFALRSPRARARIRVTENVAILRRSTERMRRRTVRYQTRVARARTLFHRRQRDLLMQSGARGSRAASLRHRTSALARIIRDLERLIAGLMLWREGRLVRGRSLLARIGQERLRVREGRQRKRVQGPFSGLSGAGG